LFTSDLVRPFLRINGRTLAVDLLNETDSHWLQTAQELIALFQNHLGQPQANWERALETYEGTRVDYLRIRGLARVLTGAATFTQKAFPYQPRDLRARLFCRGPAFEKPDMFHPLARQDLLEQAASELGMASAELDEALFSDHPGAHVLTHAGLAWTPRQLLQRYNLELSRGALYRAIVVQVEIYDSFKEFWRYLKLFKIMFLASEIPGGGYRVVLTGPLSDFVETERYGVSYAEFLPAILLGERWNLVARIKSPAPRQERSDALTGAQEQEPLLYRLDNTCGLRSYYRKGRLYDSTLERVFAEEFTDFEEKFGVERGKWKLLREEQVLVLDGSVMIPDFLLIHTQDEARRILIELVGYWSPRYLKTKIAKVKAARCPNLLLLVYEDLKVTRQDFQGTEGEVLFFKQKPVIKDVMEAVERLAQRVYGPLVPAAPPPLSQVVESYRAQIAERENAWYLLEQLEDLLRQVDPAFSPRRYGYKSLSALLKENPALFETRRRAGKGRPIEARLTQEQWEKGRAFSQ
jgi:predicted nuclease of restriction endonuclease-like RecB superfamily